jgi:hypothetical protein
MSDEVQAWIYDVHDAMLDMVVQTLGPQDGYAVVDMAQAYHDFEYLASRCVLNCHSFTHQSSVLIFVLVSFLE